MIAKKPQNSKFGFSAVSAERISFVKVDQNVLSAHDVPGNL
jgi:hypothetical protein